MKSSLHFSLFIFILSLCPVAALEFPDTVQLKKDWRLAGRTDGLPSAFYRVKSGDSSSLAIEWAPGSGPARKPISARYEQDKEFDQEAFSNLVAEYGNGGAWHEFPGAPAAKIRALYPGVQQEWLLKGFGAEKGWLASGVQRGRYFLVFRETPPTETAPVAGPLRLNRRWAASLDTSSEWLHVPCVGDSSVRAAPSKKSGKARAAAPVCFSPGDDSRLRVRIDSRAPMVIDIWLEEEESESLQAIRKAVQTVSDAGQHEYSQDLSQILLGEGQMFLVKLAQRAPGLFNWPSWQLQDFKAGRVPESRYLEIIRSEREPDQFLPALDYEDKGLRLTLDLFYRGAYHLQAREKP
jgi:hypothetical protein